MHAALTHLPAFLAAAQPHHSRFADRERAIFIALAVILGLVFIVILAATIAHKLIHRETDDHDPITGGFSLADLRKLHDAGQMSDEEFEAAKTLVIGRSRKILDEADAADKPSPGDPPSASDGDHDWQDPPNHSSDNDKPPR